jgi:2-hydroxy-3-oxopropionate reductase
MVKDLGFAADVAASTHHDRPAARVARGLRRDRDAGLGDRDISVTRRLTASVIRAHGTRGGLR